MNPLLTPENGVGFCRSNAFVSRERICDGKDLQQTPYIENFTDSLERINRNVWAISN